MTPVREIDEEMAVAYNGICSEKEWDELKKILKGKLDLDEDMGLKDFLADSSTVQTMKETPSRT